MKQQLTRRDILKGTALAAAALPFSEFSITTAAPLVKAPSGDPWRGLKAGVASYTLRKMPLDQAIKAIQRVGLKYVSIKDFHLALKSTTEERKAVAQKFKEAGITPLSCGNVGMENNEANIRNAFEYARDIGLPTIVCSPDPASMAILDKMVKEFNIKIAIHNHGPEDKKFPSPHDVWKAVELMSAIRRAPESTRPMRSKSIKPVSTICISKISIAPRRMAGRSKPAAACSI